MHAFLLAVQTMKALPRLLTARHFTQSRLMDALLFMQALPAP